MEEYILSNHAKEQIKARGIHEDTVWQIVEKPQQTVTIISEKTVYQSVVSQDGEKDHLLRIFVNAAKNPNVIITVYRTSKVQKYWQDESKVR